MPRPANPILGETENVSINPLTRRLLVKLLKTGRYGNTVSEVAGWLVARGLDDLIREKRLKPLTDEELRGEYPPDATVPGGRGRIS